ncbi:hypothetical protein [Streptomyces sp. S1]|uniref:hypothetical protein n=1 Tax=Streptomyces sp. S1 TaxID=718288 RepID=UPI003D756C80
MKLDGARWTGMEIALVASAGCGPDDGASVRKAGDQPLFAKFCPSGTGMVCTGVAQKAWWDPEQGYRFKASWIGDPDDVLPQHQGMHQCHTALPLAEGKGGRRTSWRTAS